MTHRDVSDSYRSTCARMRDKQENVSPRVTRHSHGSQAEAKRVKANVDLAGATYG
jgi:hypothetical protein